MSLAGIEIGAGIDIGNGIRIGNFPVGVSFTVNPGDITFYENFYGGYSSASSTGFTSDPGNNTGNGLAYNVSPGLYNAVLAVYSAAGLDTGQSYAWNVAWTTGGTSVVRVGNTGTVNQLVFAPIDTTFSNWQTAWQTAFYGTPTQTGTFTFPATFTLYSPATTQGGFASWC